MFRRLGTGLALSLFFSLFTSIPAAQAATLFTTMSTACDSTYGMSSNTLRTVIPVTAPAATTLTGFKLYFAPTTDATNMIVKVFGTNPTSGSPSPIGTFSYSSITGNTVNYTGSISIPSAGTYWLYFQTPIYNTPCYGMTPVTTGSASGWTSGGRASESFNSGSSWTQRSDNLTFLFTLEGSLPSVTNLSNYAPATACFWDTRQNYATLFQAGTSSTITQVRMQFEASARDDAFNATRINIYTNNSGVAGTLVGTLYPNTLASAVTAAGASVSTRVGTYIGSVNVTSGTQYWYEIRGTSSLLSACQASGMVTQANSWSVVLNSGSYNLRTSGSYSTWGLSLFIFEITTGEPDTTRAVITGPGSSTSDTATASVDENTSFTNTYTANEFVLWSIAGPDSATFTITEAGVLTTSGKNFESRSDANLDGIFTITVRAVDAAGNLKTQGLNLTISNVNESPVFGTNGGASTHSVSMAENQVNVITFTGSDPDTPTTLSWVFANSSLDRSKFAINSSTGALTFLSAPDFENRTDTNSDNIYQVVIGLSDGTNLATQTLSVTITNVAEDASIAAPVVSSTLFKGVTATISATSDYSGRVRFFMDGKRIPGCLSVPTVGTAPTAVATCTFKPTILGVRKISAYITPTSNGITPALSVNVTVTISRRTALR